MHQQISSLITEAVNVWDLHEPGEHYQAFSIATLRRYALTEDTVRVRLSSNLNGTEAEFRVDGPEGRLVWHEVGVEFTPYEVMDLNEICQQTWRAGKLEIVRNRT